MWAPSLVRAITWQVHTLTSARPHLACARPHLSAPSLGMCAPSASAPLQRATSVSNYPAYPCILLSFCLPLACGTVGCALTWHVRAVTCARPHLAFARPHLACARPHLVCVHTHLCAPSLGMCTPSLGMWSTSLVRALTWHVRTLTWHVRALSVRPSPKSNVGVQLPPYPCVLLSFCLPIASGIVGCALTWHVRALTCARPHLACARPRLACACPHLCAPSLGMCAPSLGMCVPSLVRGLTWHVRGLTSARPLRPSLSKKKCRCATTTLIRAYCSIFAFRLLVG